jgi:hypothetical protein
MKWKGNETERKKMFYNYFLATKAAMKDPRQMYIKTVGSAASRAGPESPRRRAIRMGIEGAEKAEQ